MKGFEFTTCDPWTEQEFVRAIQGHARWCKSPQQTAEIIRRITGQTLYARITRAQYGAVISYLVLDMTKRPFRYDDDNRKITHVP